MDFPGSPVVKTLHFNWGGGGSNPGWGTKIHMLHDAAEKRIEVVV